MKRLTKTGLRLVLLGLLAVLVLFGAGVSAAGTNGNIHIGGDMHTESTIAGTSGGIHIGSTIASKGIIHIWG